MNTIKNTALYRNAERHAARLAPIFEREIREKSKRHTVTALLLRVAARDARLQKGVLQFVSTLPALETTEEISRCFRQRVLPYSHAMPFLLRLGAYTADMPGLRTLGMKTAVWVIENKVAPYFIVAN